MSNRLTNAIKDQLANDLSNERWLKESESLPKQKTAIAEEIYNDIYSKEIQKQLNVSFDEAEQMKLTLGAGSEHETEIREVIDSISSSIALEIQRSLDFFTATSSVGHISKVFIVGGAAKTPGLKEIIENQIGIPVELINPFNNIEINAKNFDLEYVKDVSLMAGVAVGLALRRTGDK